MTLLTPTRLGPLYVHTAQLPCFAEDLLDVTRGGIVEHPYVEAFAPSRDWVLEARQAMARARSVSDCAGEDEDAALDQVWAPYAARYVRELRASYRAHRVTWDALLARDTVTLGCVCPLHDTRCHRDVLAAVLVKLGAEWPGGKDNRKE